MKHHEPSLCLANCKARHKYTFNHFSWSTPKKEAQASAHLSDLSSTACVHKKSREQNSTLNRAKMLKSLWHTFEQSPRTVYSVSTSLDLRFGQFVHDRLPLIRLHPKVTNLLGLQLRLLKLDPWMHARKDTEHIVGTNVGNASYMVLKQRKISQPLQTQLHIHSYNYIIT